MAQLEVELDSIAEGAPISSSSFPPSLLCGLPCPSLQSSLMVSWARVGMREGGRERGAVMTSVCPTRLTRLTSVWPCSVQLCGAGKNVVLKWQGKPLFVRHRTAEEIATAVNTPVSDLKDSVNIPLDGGRRMLLSCTLCCARSS